MNSKKLTALLLILAIVLSLAACQNQGKMGEGSVSGSAPAESSVGDISQASEGDTSTAADVEITFEQVNAAAFAEDDTMLVDCSYVTPTITMADKGVQETIQKSLDEQVAALLDMRSYYTELSTEEYTTWSTEESTEEKEGEYLPYYLYLEAKVARADSKVISVVFDKVMYAHGAHGSSEVWGCNFDAETGEYIHFADLGEHFRETAEKLALEKADEIAVTALTNGEEGPFYPNYEENIRSVVLDGSESLADVFDSFADDVEAPAGFAPTFYFTDTGITFISNEYCLQPYAAGNVELAVPYELFGDALGEEWLPTA